MLFQDYSPESVVEWKSVFDQYHARLKPNKKSAGEMIAWLQKHYPVTEQHDEVLNRTVTDNILLNKCHACKRPPGKLPVPKVFIVENSGSGASLYESQDEPFRGTTIIVGFDLETAFFMVEGSSRLWDELFAFRGLDEEDLSNFYLVAEYVACMKKTGKL